MDRFEPLASSRLANAISREVREKETPVIARPGSCHFHATTGTNRTREAASFGARAAAASGIATAQSNRNFARFFTQLSDQGKHLCRAKVSSTHTSRRRRLLRRRRREHQSRHQRRATPCRNEASKPDRNREPMLVARHHPAEPEWAAGAAYRGNAQPCLRAGSLWCRNLVYRSRGGATEMLLSIWPTLPRW